MNQKPIFDCLRAHKRIWTGDLGADLTTGEINSMDAAVQIALGGHVAPSGSMGHRDTLSLRHGRPTGAEGEE